MELELKRTIRTEISTIGELSIDGKFFCYTLEDRDRGLKSTMTLPIIESVKIKGETAIPTGTYNLKYVWSPKHKRNLWMLENVKGFSAIEIHIGNFPKDTLGGLLLGMEKGTNQIMKSTLAFNRFMLTLLINESHQITIS